MMTDIETLRYPVGRLPRQQDPLDRATRDRYVDTSAARRRGSGRS